MKQARCDIRKICRTDQAEARPPLSWPDKSASSFSHSSLGHDQLHLCLRDFVWTWSGSTAFGLQDDQCSSRFQQQWPAPAHQILHNLGLSPLFPALVQTSQLTHLPGYPNTTIPNRANIPPSRSAPIQRLQFPPPPTTPLPRRRQLNRALRCAHPNNLPHLRHALLHHDLHLDRVPARPDRSDPSLRRSIGPHV